jgi:hypothetical protein
MTSPLLPYANAFLTVDATGAPTVENGRIVATSSARYLIRCYLTRQDSTGVTTGADYLPTQASPGSMLPGTSGVAYLYRGYGLQYAQVDESYELGVDPAPGAGWTNLLSSSKPGWLMAGAQARHMQGDEPVKWAVLERVTGKFGGSNIDATISVNIGGIPLILRSGDLTG